MKPQVIERSIVASAAVLCLGVALAANVAEARGKPLPPPPPLSPPARAWHGFTSNRGIRAEQSRLYLYGGADSTPKALSDLWYYRVETGSWTSVVPAGNSKPGPRQHMGWSCGGGGCLLANGSNGVGPTAESWYYAEAPTNTWKRVGCRKSPCPSARQQPTTAYDPAGVHLLFGGRDGSEGFNDTWTFNPDTMTWKLQARQENWPTERNRAGAASVPGVGIVLLGGQDYQGRAVLCDMFTWRNNSWIGMDTAGAPCLHSHSMAWDDADHRLVVTGGYTDTSDTRSPVTYYLTFKNGVAGKWATDPDLPGCFTSLHPGAMMAFDLPTRTKVFFGGEEDIAGSVVRYGDTTTCN